MEKGHEIRRDRRLLKIVSEEELRRIRRQGDRGP